LKKKYLTIVIFAIVQALQYLVEYGTNGLETWKPSTRETKDLGNYVPLVTFSHRNGPASGVWERSGPRFPSCWAINTNTKGRMMGTTFPFEGWTLGRIQKEQVRRRRRRESNVPGQAFSHGNGPISGKGEENGPMRWLGSGERVRPSC
jgi:hypothetical protein